MLLIYGYEWDKTIFANNNQFPKFFNMLKIARANDLLHLDMVLPVDEIISRKSRKLIKIK